MVTLLAAIAFILLTAIVIVFQLALVAGAPWGELTRGGRFPGRLPAKMRLVPVLSALLLAGFAAVIAARAGLIESPATLSSGILVWVVVAYCSLGVVANAATPSKAERRLWLPVVLVMLITSITVAMS